MRQQVLQGTYLAPPAGLYCLHDTDLKPAHGLMHTPPIDGVPVHEVVGDRTSVVCCHLLCLLNPLVRCSRDERPDGSLPAFAWGDVAEAQPLSRPLQAGVRFVRPPVPAALSAGLAACFPSWERYGLTKFRLHHWMRKARSIHRWRWVPMSRDT